MRIGLKQCLWIVLLASICCMAVRSLLLAEPLGILTWPVLVGFVADRIASGTGVVGGTVGGLFGFAAIAIGLSPGLFLWGLALAAGACWGFYLSLWTYMIVETILQWL